MITIPYFNLRSSISIRWSSQPSAGWTWNVAIGNVKISPKSQQSKWIVVTILNFILCTHQIVLFFFFGIVTDFTIFIGNIFSKYWDSIFRGNCFHKSFVASAFFMKYFFSWNQIHFFHGLWVFPWNRSNINPEWLTRKNKILTSGAVPEIGGTIRRNWWASKLSMHKKPLGNRMKGIHCFKIAKFDQFTSNSCQMALLF